MFRKAVIGLFAVALATVTPTLASARGHSGWNAVDRLLRGRLLRRRSSRRRSSRWLPWRRFPPPWRVPWSRHRGRCHRARTGLGDRTVRLWWPLLRQLRLLWWRMLSGPAASLDALWLARASRRSVRLSTISIKRNRKREPSPGPVAARFLTSRNLVN